MVSKSLRVEIDLIITDFFIISHKKNGFTTYYGWMQYMKNIIEGGNLDVVSYQFEPILSDLVNFFGFEEETVFKLIIDYIKNADHIYYQNIIINYKHNYNKYIN